MGADALGLGPRWPAWRWGPADAARLSGWQAGSREALIGWTNEHWPLVPALGLEAVTFAGHSPRHQRGPHKIHPLLPTQSHALLHSPPCCVLRIGGRS